MDETTVRFMGSTKNVGESIVFSCVVEYSSNLDPFLPQDLKKQTDFDGVKTTVSPFLEGRGSFTTSSIERAVTVEAEIKAKLQIAYRALVERRVLIGKWTGAREYGLDFIRSEENHEETMALFPLGEQLAEEE